jgi:hypothetical protein
MCDFSKPLPGRQGIDDFGRHENKSHPTLLRPAELAFGCEGSLA